MRKGVFFAGLWLVAAAATVSAKPSVGALTGIVLDGKGAPVARARVFWQAADGGSPHILRTGANGHFRVTPLRTGLYEVRAEAGGNWSEWQHNVLVPPGREASVVLRLVRASPPQ